MPTWWLSTSPSLPVFLCLYIHPSLFINPAPSLHPSASWESGKENIKGERESKGTRVECRRKWRKKKGNSQRNGENGRDGWRDGGGWEDCRVVLVESWGIDSGPFDMLICLLTALIVSLSITGFKERMLFKKRRGGGNVYHILHFYGTYAADGDWKPC